MNLLAAVIILPVFWLPFYATTVAFAGGSASWVSATVGWAIWLALSLIVHAATKD